MVGQIHHEIAAQCRVPAKRLLAFVLLLLVALGAAWLMSRPPSAKPGADGPGTSHATADPARAPSAVGNAGRDAAGPASPGIASADAPPRGASEPSPSVRHDRARRDAVREQIRERRREGRAPSHDRTAAQAPAEPVADGETGFVNRMGEEHAELAKAINRELGALTDECIAAATERDGKLAGTLEMAVAAVADPELGAVIDTVDVTTQGEAVDAELIECVRESALSMVLPAQEGGDVAFVVSMRLP